MREVDNSWNRRSMGKSCSSSPLVVLSLFDGIGGLWVALQRLGIPFIGYSCDLDWNASRVVKRRFPFVHNLGDVRKLSRDSIAEPCIDLIVAAFPGQGLSCMTKMSGLHGNQSSLISDLLHAIHVFTPHWFLVENETSLTWMDRDEISKYLSCLPIEIDSQDLTPSRGRKFYWTNIPHPKSLPNLRNHHSTSLQSFIENATSLETKCGCILGSNYHMGGGFQLQQVLDNTTNTYRSITIEELESIMGYPKGYTDVTIYPEEEAKEEEEETLMLHSTGSSEDPPEKNIPRAEVSKDQSKLADTNRWNLLGNAFSVPVIMYLLSPLLGAEKVEKVTLKTKHINIKEEDISVMKEGEVWALSNPYKHPNWYAVICKSNGDFPGTNSPKRKKTRIQTKVEVQFLELTYEYATKEDSSWTPCRGTGRYRINKEMDIQNSWLSFSHRVDGFFKLRHCYFIYPVKNEIWAVLFRNQKKSPCIFMLKAESTKVFWIEGGWAKKVLWLDVDYYNKLFNLTSSELYTCKQAEIDPKFIKGIYPNDHMCTEKEIELRDLSDFCFRAPYYYRDESGLYALDVGESSQEALLEGWANRVDKKRRYSLNNLSDEEDA